MLNGHFENCYGLKQLNLPNINFSRCNKTMIYAPNGVMKSSLSKVFDDIRIANSCVADNANEVLLDNKLVVAIAIRLNFSGANGNEKKVNMRG